MASANPTKQKDYEDHHRNFLHRPARRSGTVAGHQASSQKL